MWQLSGASKRSPSRQTRRSASETRPPSPSAILTETLRKNPFRPTWQGLKEGEDADTTSLNKDLFLLADVFPDVQVEVLRELLKRFDGNSRLLICSEQFYKYKAEWARGRLQVPPRDPGDRMPLEQQFRSRVYIERTFRILSSEFRSVSKDVIRAVMAENNDCYSKCRPTLYNIANKSTWNILANAIGLKKKKALDVPPSAILEKGKLDASDPRLLRSGSSELDVELHKLFVHPLMRRGAADQESTDFDLARLLNRQEAEQAEALFECQVCYNDVPFEDASACSSETHIVCLDCLRRTLHEALFGQGWAKSVNTSLGTVNCLASADCTGHVPQSLMKRSVLAGKGGAETWAKFESRLASDSLITSSLPLITCPFCPYAEADTIYTAATARNIKWRFRLPPVSTVVLILLLEALPMLLFILIPLVVLFNSTFTNLFYTSLAHAHHRKRSTRFACLNPSCQRKSCLKCFKPWHDPHICHEPLILSLRKTVEAARTAAVKRTCPRCGTSFVKSSGCNKLTCVCGYSMCYLCRTNIGKAGSAGQAAGAEGYRHFCEHFRPNPGQKCTECDKCDLYESEDEDGNVRRAGEEAERLWREREGMVGVKGLEEATGNLGWKESALDQFLRGNWTVQGFCDRVVEGVVRVRDD